MMSRLLISWLVTTIFTRPGKGLPIDSHVFLPIITTEFLVVLRKCFISSGISHGSLLSLPITPFGSIAAMIDIMLTTAMKIYSYSHRKLYDRVRIVIFKNY